MKSRLVIIALVSLSAVIVYLAIANDLKYNTKRDSEAEDKEIMELCIRAQIDSLTMRLQDMSSQLDMINGILMESKEAVERDLESANQSFGRLEKTSRQILNAIK